MPRGSLLVGGFEMKATILCDCVIGAYLLYAGVRVERVSFFLEDYVRQIYG